MATKRKYELKKRAEQLAETRRRITEATVELHRTVGPAATRISEVARRAGEILAEPFARRDRVDAALRAALDFHFWRALAPLGDEEAAELAAGLVELAAGS